VVTLTVHGDGGFREQLTVTTAPDRAVRTCWGRARVRDLEDSYTAIGASPELADRIVAVSLAHRVLSRFTAFVAVDRSRRTGAGAPQPVLQPVELPGGWSAAGLMQLAGGAVPERLFRAAPSAPQAGSNRFSSDRAPRRSRAVPLPKGLDWEAMAEEAARASAERAERTALDGYLTRAGELFDRIQRDLDSGHDLGPAAAAADELAADLSSVAAPGFLIDALRDLVSALRDPVDPRRGPRGGGDPLQALAAAREAFGQRQTPRAPGPRPTGTWPRPMPPGGAPQARREWWR